MAVLPFGIPMAFMFVPAREKFLADPGRLGSADVLVFDLEDSLKKEEKDEGLALLSSLRKEKKEGPAKWYARLNNDRLSDELSALKDSCLDGYMFPKFEDTKVLDEYADLIAGKEISALIETPAGVAAVERLAADGRIKSFAFGAEDFCACLNVDTNPSAIAYAQGRIVLYCALYGKCSIDMISREFKDREAFKSDLVNSMKSGFTGKLLIHPMQLEVVDEIKNSIPKEEIRSIIEAYEKDPSGAVNINGRLYERMHIERLKRML